MTNVYKIKIKIEATAYVKENTEEEAFAKVKEIHLDSLHVSGDEMISGLQFDDPDLPEISLSPAMTIGEACPDGCELVHPDLPEPDNDEEEGQPS